MELVADEANESVAVVLVFALIIMVPVTVTVTVTVTMTITLESVNQITSDQIILNESSRIQSDGGGKSKHTQRS